MYIHFQFLKHQVMLRKTVPSVNTPIGSRLKHFRMQLNLTLEESSENICSISYLSKVENNQIRPSVKFLSRLESRYGITLGETPTTAHDELMSKLIDAFFYEDAFNLPDQFSFDIDYKSKLLNFGHTLIENDYHKAKSLYFDLVTHLKCFTDLELSTFLYMVAKIFIDEGRLKDAFDCLNLTKPYDKKSKLAILIDKMKLEVSLLMNNHPYLMTHYQSLIDLCLSHEYYHLVHQIRFSYLCYLAQFIKKEDFDRALQQTSHFTDAQHAYLIAKHEYEHGSYQDCYNHLNGYIHYHKRNYMLAIKALNKLNMKEELISLLQIPLKTNDIQYGLIIEYLKVKYLKKHQTPGSFIRSEVLKVHELADNIEDLMFWYEEGMELFKEQGFYKDATQLSQTIFQQMRQLAHYIS